MNNSICINPVDGEMSLLVNSINILNEYKKRGISKRDSFVEFVMDKNNSYNNLDGMKKLNNFWAGRVKDEVLNGDLNKILQNFNSSEDGNSK